MQDIVIKLSEDDQHVLEYYIFAYDGIKVNLNQFLFNNLDFNEENYNRLIDTLIEKYSDLQKKVYEILQKYNYKNIPVKTYDFFLNEGVLKIKYN